MNALDAALTLLAATSWRIGLLILLCFGMRRLLRGRLPAAAGFAVWLVLGLALLVPAGFPATWSPFGLLPRWERAPQQPAAATSLVPLSAAMPSPTAPGLTFPAVTAPTPAQASAIPPSPPLSLTPPSTVPPPPDPRVPLGHAALAGGHCPPGRHPDGSLGQFLAETAARPRAGG
jgi:hypothetical protein